MSIVHGWWHRLKTSSFVRHTGWAPAGSGASLVVVLASPLVPAVLQPGFGQAVRADRFLSLVPLFRGIHQIAGGALTGAGYPWRRTAAQPIAVVLNIALNLSWIPSHRWVGAA